MALVQILLIAQVINFAVFFHENLETAAAEIILPPCAKNDSLLFAERANAPFQESDELVDLQRQKRSRR